MRIFIIIASLIFISKLSIAQTPYIYALHINGINTNRVDARANVDALKELAKIDSNMVKWDIVYNPTGDDAGAGFWSNLFDVISQKSKEQKAVMTLDDFTHYWIRANNLPDYPEDSKEYKDLKAQITSKYTEQLNKNAGVNFQTIIDDFHGKIPPQFASVLSLLRADSTTDDSHKNTPPQFASVLSLLDTENSTFDYSKCPNYIILLPHSQGNLYANSLWKYLTGPENFDKEKIAIFGIATPANSNASEWIKTAWQKYFSDQAKITKMFGEITTYLTSSNDFVINGARVLFNQYPDNIILPSNIDIKFSINDIKGHNLIETYLADSGFVDKYKKMLSYYMYMYYMNIMKGNDKNVDYQIEPHTSFQLVNITTKTIYCKEESCVDGIHINTSEYKTGELLSKDTLPYGKYYLTVEPYLTLHISTPFKSLHGSNDSTVFNDICFNEGISVTCRSKPMLVHYISGEIMPSSLREFLPYATKQLGYRFWNNLYVSSQFVLKAP